MKRRTSKYALNRALHNAELAEETMDTGELEDAQVYVRISEGFTYLAEVQLKAERAKRKSPKVKLDTPERAMTKSDELWTALHDWYWARKNQEKAVVTNYATAAINLYHAYEAWLESDQL